MMMIESMVPTDRIVDMGKCRARVWCAVTARGTDVFVYVTAFAVAKNDCSSEDLEEFIELSDGQAEPLIRTTEELGLGHSTEFRG